MKEKTTLKITKVRFFIKPQICASTKRHSSDKIDTIKGENKQTNTWIIDSMENLLFVGDKINRTKKNKFNENKRIFIIVIIIFFKWMILR